MTTAGLARSGTVLSTPELVAPTSARIFDLFDEGKSGWSEDQEVVELMLELEPTLPLQMTRHRAERSSLTGAIAAASQLVVLGCGLPNPGYDDKATPMATPPHEAAGPWCHDTGRQRHTVYVDHDIQVCAEVRAWWEQPARKRGELITLLDLDVRDSSTLLAGLTHTLDLDVPVGVLSTLLLDHLTDTEVTDLAGALASLLPPGSEWGITHLNNSTGAAEAYNAAVPDGHLEARTADHLRDLITSAGWGAWTSPPPVTRRWSTLSGRRPIVATAKLGAPA